MNYTTHNQAGMAEVMVAGTSLQGCIDCDYDTLVRAFGLPFDGDGYKVDAEWNIVFEDGTRATIYNWKNGRNYCGDEGLYPEEITEWHIGGFDKKAVERVTEVIN